MISSLGSGTAEGWRKSRPLGGSSGFGGKKWFRSASLISTGELAPGSSGKGGTLREVTNFFAVQMLWDVVFARKSFQ